jgi:ribosomal protein L13E
MSEKAAKRAPTRKTRAKKAAPKQKKKAKSDKKEEKQVKVKTMMAEMKPAPSPIVLARHERGMQERDARGYSLGELESVGIPFLVAKRLKVPIDLRRSKASAKTTSSKKE